MFLLLQMFFYGYVHKHLFPTLARSGTEQLMLHKVHMSIHIYDLKYLLASVYCSMMHVCASMHTVTSKFEMIERTVLADEHILVLI